MMRRLLARLFGLELLFVLLWNSGFIGAEYGLPYAGPWTLMLWRYASLTLLLGLWLVLRRQLRWPGAQAVGHAAIVGVLAHGVWLSCVMLALKQGVPAGIVALATALQPLVTGALSGHLLGERTEPRQWIGLLHGFVGVAIAIGARLSLDSPVPKIAYLLPFLSMAGMTIASLLQRGWAKAGTSADLPLDMNLFYQGLATALALLGPAWWLEGFATDWTPPFIATLAWLILPVSFGAYWTMWRLLTRQEATRVASLFYLSPPVTMLMAWAAFGDTLMTTDLIGLMVAGMGVMLVYSK
ncbi:MAG: DMT family transporter [Lamprobacter sp.]|uniref:DMT family transporter n=1 Tax=Lamprobacter sp. TaxID=3100796 RepID=UPI002B2636B3|nr:DMT family transporter [Lamprobacter sp.]MEA3641447.1 DMT family transporter [Lamprobacter sp.]